MNRHLLSLRFLLPNQMYVPLSLPIFQGLIILSCVTCLASVPPRRIQTGQLPPISPIMLFLTHLLIGDAHPYPLCFAPQNEWTTPESSKEIERLHLSNCQIRAPSLDETHERGLKSESCLFYRERRHVSPKVVAE